METIYNLRKIMYREGNAMGVTEKLLNLISTTKNNKEFLEMLNKNFEVLAR
jgi:transcription termination factor Rho